MSTDALKDKLKELHAALAEAGRPADSAVDPIADPRADAELQQLLRQLDGDIRSLLHKDSELATRAQSISARFSAQHPRLAPVLRELTDMLASMGI